MSDHRWVLAFHLVFDFPHLHWIFLAMLLGILTGALSCRFRIVGEFLEPPIQFMKSIPVASFVILALIWTGSKNLSILISFLVAYPILHISTVSGLKSTASKLLEMAQVFRVPFHKSLLPVPSGAVSLSDQRL